MVRLLDLFCGAGGATVGYQSAGFHVTGVDIRPQRHYIGNDFVQADALTFPFEGFDAIHASPPCQPFTPLRTMPTRRVHADLVGAIRKRLIRSRVPYVIENVPGAPLRQPVTLCGTSFGLGVDDAELRRHRLFELGRFTLANPPRCHHVRRRVIGVYGHSRGHDKRRREDLEGFSAAQWSKAMCIDWMSTRELALAVPPVYTFTIGQALREAIA